MDNLKDPVWKDGPPESGKEVVLVFEVRVTVTQDDPDDDGGRAMEREIHAALEKAGVDVTDVEHTGTEDA
jgi:hypothetical protein